MESKVYDIVLHSPIGPKKGTLTLFREDDTYSADIYLMRHLNHFAVMATSAGEYCLSGALRTLVGDVACQIHLTINGILTAVAETAKGIMRMEGCLAESSDGKDC